MNTAKLREESESASVDAQMSWPEDASGALMGVGGCGFSLFQAEPPQGFANRGDD
jgi:hypothetical protein